MINLEKKESCSLLKFVWGNKCASVVTASFNTDFGYIFQDWNGNFWCTTKNTGQVLWKIKVAKSSSKGHLFNNQIYTLDSRNQIYTISNKNNIYIIDPETGTITTGFIINSIYMGIFYKGYFIYIQKKRKVQTDISAELRILNLNTKEDKELYSLLLNKRVTKFTVLGNRGTVLLLNAPDIEEIQIESGKLINRWIIPHASGFYGGIETGDRILLTAKLNMNITEKINQPYLLWDHLPYSKFKKIGKMKKAEGLKRRVCPLIYLDKDSVSGYLVETDAYKGKYSSCIDLSENCQLVYSQDSLWVFEKGNLLKFIQLEKRIGNYLGFLSRHKSNIYIYYNKSEYIKRGEKDEYAYIINTFKFDIKRKSILPAEEDILAYFLGKNFKSPMIDQYDNKIIMRGDRRYCCLEYRE
jgi:hypothetical protein